MQRLNDLRLFPVSRRFSDDEKPFLCFDATADIIGTSVYLDDGRGRFGVCPAIQSRSLQIASLAQHWSVSRRPHARRRRSAFTTECLLHRSSERGRLEDGCLWPHLCANL